MSEVGFPDINGRGWRPEKALKFSNPLPADEARFEVLRFVAERHDGHLQKVATTWDQLQSQASNNQFDGRKWHSFSNELLDALSRGLSIRLHQSSLDKDAHREVVPRRDLEKHLDRRGERFLIDIALCLRRIAHYMAIKMENRLEWQRLMLRTRALDEHLKDIFAKGMETPDGGKFGGKGFRSTWQEGVVAVATALNRQVESSPGSRPGEGYEGDLVAPMIRDVGLALAMGDTPKDVMAAQMGKSASNQDGGWSGMEAGGRDLHIGCWHRGVLPPTAPLPIASATMTGLALAAKLSEVDRFHVACIGEGASSSGEWWEAINLAGTRSLPMTFILQNNQIALDTVSTNQSGVELWADKAVAMGIPSWSIDGSDVASWHASVAVAREFSIQGGGSTLIHVETMRGCGHAHHHDDLYLGAESGNPPGYVNREMLDYWADKDPIEVNKELLLSMGVSEDEISSIEDEEQDRADQARVEVEAMSWPAPETVTLGVTSLHDADTHQDRLNRDGSGIEAQAVLSSGEVDVDFDSSSGSWTYARAIQQAMVAIAERHGEEVVFMGEDMEVAGAFGMNLALKNAGHEDKLLDMPLSEAVIINAATGAALHGMRPMAEIQFGGFAALAFNALVNNAAMLRWRWGAEVPLTVRIPLGGHTRSGPFHANIIESWFANDPGLVVVAPATPQDAYDLLLEAAELDDPVIFLEHIGLYGLRGGLTGWGDMINQKVDTEPVKLALNQGRRHVLGKAKVVRGGGDLTLVCWGAMLHVSLKAAAAAAEKGIEVEVIDLRTIVPFDYQTCIESLTRTGRLLIVQESQWSGGLGHTIQSRIMEDAFWSLENKPVIIGALDTPVPFSPPLENHTIPDVEFVLETIISMCE